MKRIGNLYHKIYDMNNLILADKRARRGKKHRYSIRKFDKDRTNNLIKLQTTLKNKVYNTSKYTVYTIFDPKEREIYRLPYYPDRVIHHAIMNIVEPIFVKSFTSNTYSCIKRRGIHKALYILKDYLKDIKGTKYCLKIDIKKFYPSIDHDILKRLLRRKFKDKDFLDLLDNIIDSASGIPIGNYLSQYFANFYLSGFDHWIKEQKKVKYYLRYCDDIVILASTKKELWSLFSDIKSYLKIQLNLELKENYQVFPVQSRGIDFVGYRSYHTHILLRKRIKIKFINMIKYNRNSKSIASYNGWLSHCNSRNLRRKYLC